MPVIDQALRDALVAHLRFYRDIGVTDLYRQPVDPELVELLQAEASTQVSKARPGASHAVGNTDPGPPEPVLSSSKDLASQTWDTPSEPQVIQENEPIPTRKPISPPP